MSYPVRSWRREAARRDPFAAFEAMQERINRAIGEAFTGYRGRTPMWHPDVEMEETGDGWEIEIRLPGVAPEEVAIDIDDRELHVHARHEEETTGGEEPAGEQAQIRERRWEDFSYRLTMPSDVDTGRVEAMMDHGLLTIRLPRSTSAGHRTITVGGGGAVEGQQAETQGGGEQAPAGEQGQAGEQAQGGEQG